MRKNGILFFVGLVILTGFLSAKSVETAADWSSGTAYVLPAGRWEMGLFQPLRYGLSGGQEFSTHPLLFVKMPNLTYKRVWKADERGVIASRHQLLYPTPLLNTVARKGIGGIVSPEFTFPAMVSLHNEVLYTKKLMGSMQVTGKAGITVGVAFGDLDKRMTIDLPLVFQRLAVFYNNWLIRLGGDVTGHLSGRWNYLVDSDVFLIPGAEENFGFEHKGLLLWNKSDRFQLAIGYKLVYGQYPYGTQWHLLPPKVPGLPVWIPLFDLQWAW
ncbi:MAG: hypothetical protein GXO92_03900 [FCB group bacterium]|nr:hypothetical protein [FCB group bacterium]